MTKNKKTSLLITSVIVGALGGVAFAPSAFAFGFNGNQAQQKFNQMHQKAHMQGQMKPGQMKPSGIKAGARGGFVNFACSDKVAPKMEERLNKMSERLELTSEQKLLFEDFKTASLSAQITFADNCTKPEKDADFVEKMKAKQNNMANGANAMGNVIPEFEAFINSLSDEQKAKLKKGKLAYQKSS